MKNSELASYTDYLSSTLSTSTATGLLAIVDGDVSHDQITQFLSVQEWRQGDTKAVRLVRQVFKNKNDSTAVLPLVCSNSTCDQVADSNGENPKQSCVCGH